MIPFLPRRGPEDAESRAHARAIRLAAERLSGPLLAEEDAWLGAHLERCDACASVAAEYEAQSALLRSLPSPEPPRDLWARTADAIDAEGRGRTRSMSSLVPLGALSGALVVAVVVGAAVLSSPSVPMASPSPQALPSVALVSPSPGSTPIAVAAGQVGWVSQREDGTYTVAYAPIRHVCAADIKPDCPPLAAASPVALTLDTVPGAIVGAPDAKTLVVVDSKTKTTGGSLYVVDVAKAAASPVPSAAPTASPSGSGAPTSSPSPAPSTSPVPPSPSPKASPTPGASASTAPSSSAGASPSPTASSSATPPGTVALVTGVVVVGDTGAYSPDGRWFAFSARPADGSRGPDIYVWSPGDPAAHPLTQDHGSVFSGWTGDLIVGSRAEVTGPSPSTSPEPSSSASAQASSAPASRTPSSEPSTIPSIPAASPTDPLASPAPVIATPTSFVLDPETGATATVPADAMWRPVVDASGTYVAYWHGTVRLADNGVDWLPDTGSLVVDRWSGSGVTPVAAESPSPGATSSASPGASSGPASPSVRPSEPASPSVTPAASPSASIVPTGLPGVLPVVLTNGVVRDWDMHWDETGTRLAVWVADPVDATVGSLALHTLDRATDALDPQGVLLDQQPALASFSIGSGRLAWATPPGQGGEGSRVEVLAWSGTSAGRIESQPGPGPGPVVVIR